MVSRALTFLESSDGAVREWGISQCTLEDVFLSVTRASGFIDAKQGLALASGATLNGAAGPAAQTAASEEVVMCDKGLPPRGGGRLHRRRSTGSGTELAALGGLEPADQDAPRSKESVLDVREAAVARRGGAPRLKLWYQTRGLLKKNATLQKRSGLEFACQIGVPVLVMLLMVVLQAIVVSQEKKFGLRGGEPVVSPAIYYGLQTGLSLEVPPAVLALLNQTRTNGSAANAAAALPSTFQQLFDGGANATQGSHCLQHFLFSSATGQADAVGRLDRDGRGAGLLRHIPQKACEVRKPGGGGETLRVPYFQERGSRLAMETELFEGVANLTATPMKELEDEPAPAYALPDGMVAFHNVSWGVQGGGGPGAGAGGVLNYTFASNDLRTVAYHRPNGLSRANVPLPKNMSLFNLQVLKEEGRLGLMDRVHTAYAARFFPLHHLLRAATPPQMWSALKLQNLVASMPEVVKSASISRMVEVFAGFFIPVALSLQLPTQLYLTVMEKESKLIQIQQMHGLSMPVYRLVAFLFNFAMYLLVVAFFTGCGALMSIRFFTETGAGVAAAFYAGWGLAQVALAYFCSALISDSRLASVVGYAVVLFGTGFGIMICQGVYADSPLKPEPPVMPAAFLLWPQFAMIRAVFLMNSRCSLMDACVRRLSDVPELRTALLFLYFDAALYLAVGTLLDGAGRRARGAAAATARRLAVELVLRCARCCGRGLHPRRKARDLKLMSPEYRHRIVARMASRDQLAPIADSAAGDSSAAAAGDDDSDVEDEAARARRASPGDHPLVAAGLRKEFGAKAAVDGVSLVVERGECFGLLGENGAGKTTLIGLLGAAAAPSAGRASVCGFDTRAEAALVHMHLGVCPQHDLLWDQLTVREHVLLYARLKGISPAQEAAAAAEALASVGLGGLQHRRAGRLSGGMRRRLSVAVALVGASQVVLLDEMTTGLDPYSRRQMWSVLARARRGRAMLLTTHSMEEAELLCSRIGIMSRGRLRALGTSQHLKAKYGTGNLLVLDFPPARRAAVLAYVRARFPSAALLRENAPGGHAVLQLPGGGGGEGGLARVFNTLAGSAAEAGIEVWAVQQAGLEEIFHRVVAAAEGRPPGGGTHAALPPSGPASAHVVGRGGP